MSDEETREAIIEAICQGFEDGKSLNEVCAAEGMPHRTTVYRWVKADSELGERLRTSREIGFIGRAENLLQEIRDCDDPVKARVILDAERWILGRMSHVLADKPATIGVQVNVDSSNAFATIARALEQAAATRASLAHSTSEVVIDGEARPVDAGGELAGLAPPGGTRIRENSNGR